MRVSSFTVYWATVCMLSVRCLSVLSVCLWRWCIVAKR